MQERQRSWSVVWDLTSCRVQASFHAPSVALERAATASSAMAASTGCTEMQWAQALDKRPWLQMYKVLGNCMPFGWQTTEESPGQTWQACSGSFLLLPRRHALSSRWLWIFNHNMCKNRLEEVQGSATSSFFTPPLFQNTWPCVQFLCAEHNAPCQQDLAIDKAKPPASAAKWQGNDQTDLQCQAAIHCHHQVQWATCPAWHWGYWSFWRRDDSDGMDMWNALMVHSQHSQPFTYRLRESMDLGGPRWHGSSWQRGIAESGSSWLSTLMIEICGDLVWDLPCVQQASYLEVGPLMWMLPLYLHVNQKSSYDMIGKLFSYNPNFFPWGLSAHAPRLCTCIKLCNFKCLLWNCLGNFRQISYRTFCRKDTYNLFKWFHTIE